MESRKPFSSNSAQINGDDVVGRTRSLEDTRGGGEGEDVFALRWELKEKDATIQLLNEKHRREIDYLKRVISRLEEESTSSHFTDKDLAITKLQDELFASLMQHRQAINTLEQEHAAQIELIKQNMSSEYSGIIQHLSEEKSKLEAELEKLREMTVDEMEEEEFHAVDLVRLSGSKDRVEDSNVAINELRSKQYTERLNRALEEQRKKLESEHMKERALLLESRTAALSDLREHIERQYRIDVENAVELVKSESEVIAKKDYDAMIITNQRNLQELQSQMVQEKDEIYRLHRQEIEEIETKYKQELKIQGDEFEHDYKVAMDEVRLKAQEQSAALRAKDDKLLAAQEDIANLKKDMQAILDNHEAERDKLHRELLSASATVEKLKSEMTQRNNDQNSQVEDYKIAVEKLQTQIDEYETTLRKNYDEYLLSIQEHKEANAIDKRMYDATIAGLTQELQNMQAKYHKELEDKMQDFTTKEVRLRADNDSLVDRLGAITAAELVARNEIASLRAELERLQNNLLEKEVACSRAVENNKIISTSLSRIKAENSELRNEKDKLLADISNFKRSTEDDLATLRGKLEDIIIHNKSAAAITKEGMEMQLKELRQSLEDRYASEHAIAKAKIIDEMGQSHALSIDALRTELANQQKECIKWKSSHFTLLESHMATLQSVDNIATRALS